MECSSLGVLCASGRTTQAPRMPQSQLAAEVTREQNGFCGVLGMLERSQNILLVSHSEITTAVAFQLGALYFKRTGLVFKMSMLGW